MKTLIPLLCLTSATLFANIEFSSNEVDAHESEVVLKGNVLIKHPLGTLAAREATLFQEVANQDNSTFLSASLRSGVELQFTSQQPLHCEAATIDFVHNQASLSKVSVGQDQIKADSASLEMEKETLILYKPIGKIASNLINLTRPDEICFSSNILNWDRKTGELSLKENILVDGNSFGAMRSTDKIAFATEKVDEKLLFKGFKATGKSHLITPGGMKIICDGLIEFDHDKHHLSATSINEPIVYENGELRIESNQLTFDQLEGNPKIISFFDHVTFASGSMYGTAGGLTYKPDEHTLEFFSLDQENVVFHNKETDFKMCADSLSITKDPITQENIIQGHGIVKLTFDHKQRDELLETLNSCMNQSF